MFDLICFVIKSIAIAAIVRLIITVFGWEYGISRQYLRVLDVIFEYGQRRIEKVESKNRFHHTVSFTSSESAETNCESNHDCSDCSEAEAGDGDGDGHNEHVDKTQSAPTPRHKHNSEQQHKMRRISTPDGPPVFLLDDNLGESNARQREFHLLDVTKFIVKGMSAIIDDQVTKRFTTEELKSWNLLTRNNRKYYQFMSRSLGLYWVCGLFIRYSILLPIRIFFTIAGLSWLVCTTAIIGILPRRMREKPYKLFCLMSFRMLASGVTSRLKFHDRQYRARNGEICVANHTTPLDIVLLACDNCYSLVGQRHGGLLGILERALSRATNHVWFDRGEMRDRQLVTQRIKQFIDTKTNLPVLIFPEGTCINNSAVMMFRKGSFETTDQVCPAVMKYDPRYGDPFWNSSKQSYTKYLLLVMSSWAIKCDVWYLPPMHRFQGESPAEFANRVKAAIARKGGLVDLAWDGQLKRSEAKLVWRHQQQEDYARRLKLE